MNKVWLLVRNKYTHLYLVLTIFLLVVLFVNPLRETAVEDDWAYALTVRRLLETGRYESHPWTAPNMPFQAYWGMLFARLLGYSFSSLRIATLSLVLLGLIGFYYLAIEHELNDTQAGLLTLALLASPLVLRFSFSFMTDIPFLMCLIVSLLLYTRAVRTHHYLLMLVASLVATATILTRQAGIALVGGLFLTWVLDKVRRQQTLFFLTGFVLPAVAGLWQGVSVLLTQNWAVQYLERLESRYIAGLGTLLLDMLLWRPTVILHYLVLFSLPLVLVLLLFCVHQVFEVLDASKRRVLLTALMLSGFAVSLLTLLFDRLRIGRPGFGLEQRLVLTAAILLTVASWWLLRSAKRVRTAFCPVLSRETVRYYALLLGTATAYIVAGMLYGHFLKGHSIFLPYLPWSFEMLRNSSWLVRGVITLITSLGAVLLLYTLIVRYSGGPGLGTERSSTRLIDFTTVFLLVQQLIFPLLGDRYVLVFLPFTLLVIGRHFGAQLERLHAMVLIACLLTLVFSAMWTRGSLELSEALWKGAEYVRSSGVQASHIYGSWMWIGYYRFQDYLVETGKKDAADFFERWLPKQRELAEFRLTGSLDPPGNGEWYVVADISYRDMWFREQHVYAIRRESKER